MLYFSPHVITYTRFVPDSSLPPACFLSRCEVLSQIPVIVCADDDILGMEHASYAYCAYGVHIPAHNVRGQLTFPFRYELDDI